MKTPYIFEIIETVRDYELDFQGIVNNSNYLHYFEHTRHQFLEQLNINVPQLHTLGIDPVVIRSDLQYKYSLRSKNTFASRLYLRKEGVKIVFYQDIYKLPEEILCIKGRIESVVLDKGKISRKNLFNKALEEFF